MLFRFLPLIVLLASPVTHAARFEKNVPTPLIKMVQDDLRYLESMEGNGSSPLNRVIFGSVSGASYIKWFNSRIHNFAFDPDDDATTTDMLAYNDSFGSTDTIILRPAYLNSKIPQIVRIMLLLHEARHAEPNHFNWGHDRCPDVFNDEMGQPIRSRATGLKLAGRLACDKLALGAYGIAKIFLNNVERFCTTCAPGVKAIARDYESDQLNRITDPKARSELQKDAAGL